MCCLAIDEMFRHCNSQFRRVFFHIILIWKKNPPKIVLFYLIHWQFFKSCIKHFFQTLQKRWSVKHPQNKNGKKDNVTSSNRNSFFEHAPSMSVVEFVLKYSYISHSIDFYSCNLVYVLFFRSKNDLSVSVFDSFLMEVIAIVIAPSINIFLFCCL